MGIDTSSVLLWGATHDEMPEGFDTDAFDQGSPYYDSGYDACIFGVAVAYSGDYQCRDMGSDLQAIQQLIANARVEFKKRTGLEGRLYLSPHIT